MTVSTLERRMRDALSAACGIVLALMLALVMATTAQRYLLSGGFLGADEAAVWLFLLLACLGFPLAGRGALALRVDLLAGRMGARADTLRGCLSEAVVCAACIVLAVAGTKAALRVGGTSPLLGLGEWLRPAALAGAGIAGLVFWALFHAAGDRIRTMATSALIALAACGAVWAGISTDIARPSVMAGIVIGLGIVLAAPLPHVFILAGFLALAAGSPLVEPSVALAILGGIGRPLLLAIPFFLLAGGLLVLSGMAGDLMRFAASLVGRLRGGLAHTVLLSSVLFSGASGSSIAHAAFGARTFVPPLVESGYRPERAGALVAATAILDNVIPPSIAFLILATATNLPVGPLLLGGFFAGLLLAAALAVAIWLQPGPTGPAPPLAGSRTRLAIRALPVFGLGLIVVAGIRLGIVTPTEAAALAATYTLVLAVRRSTGGLLVAFREAGQQAAAIAMLIGAAAPLAFLLATDGVASAAADMARALGDDPLMVMLAANLVLLVVGLVLDIGAAILLFGPILLPVAVAVGIDPVHFGVVLVVNLMIGGITPPVGILVQVVGAATGASAAALFRAVLPYLAALLAALFVMSLAVALPAGFDPA